jgi:hypothetical protein
MPYQREHYERWIRDFLQKRRPDLVEPFRDAIEAFEEAMASGVLSDAQLAKIDSCTRSESNALAENSAGLLGELSSMFPGALGAIRRLSQDSSQHVRLQALVALHGCTTPGFREELLRRFLQDRSSRLRLLAADKIVLFGLQSLLSDLEQAIARERNQRTRERLQWQHDLLRDGFRTQRRGDGELWMTCRLPDGSLRSAHVSNADVESKGLRSIAKQMGADI